MAKNPPDDVGCASPFRYSRVNLSLMFHIWAVKNALTLERVRLLQRMSTMFILDYQVGCLASTEVQCLTRRPTELHVPLGGQQHHGVHVSRKLFATLSPFANRKVRLLSTSGMSLIYTTNRIGPRTNPHGILDEAAAMLTPPFSEPDGMT